MTVPSPRCACSAREAIERIGDALARIDDGSYAICESCSRPIPFEHLEASPDTRLCAACSTYSVRDPAPSVRSAHVEEGASNSHHDVKRLVTTRAPPRRRN